MGVNLMRRSLWVGAFLLSPRWSNWVPLARIQTIENVSSAYASPQTSYSNNLPKPIVKSSDLAMSNVASNDDKSSRSQVGLSFDLKSYNLLWSPGVMKKTFLVASTLFLASFLQHAFGTGSLHLSNHFWPTNVVSRIAIMDLAIPLLGSACCLLQLTINLVAGGCAGFNTYLGPLRPYFLALLFYLTVTVPSNNWLSKLLFRWSLALLPEGLHLWNLYREKTFRTATVGPNASVAKVETEQVTEAVLDARIKIDIPTMGCVACIHTIDSALVRAVREHNNGALTLVGAASFLNPPGAAKGGYATVRVQTPTRIELDTVMESLIDSIRQAGFDNSKIASVDVKTKEKGTVEKEHKQP